MKSSSTNQNRPGRVSGAKTPAPTPLLLLLTALCTALSLPAQTPSVITDHSLYLPGETIIANFKSGPANPKDWIGIYPEGIVPGTVGSTIWFYTDNTKAGTKGLAEGSVTFAGGLNLAGDWVAYLLLNDGYTKLAQTKFKVIDPAQPFVRLDKRVYAPGETISVAFTNGPANAKDWIGIYREGQTPSSSTPSTIWFYVDGTKNGTAGKSEGVIKFTTGLSAAGNYAAYLLLNDGYTALASEPFSVALPAGAGPRILSVRPANNSSNVPPVVEFLAAITNNITQVASNSVVLVIDGARVIHTFAQPADLVTITYTNQALLPPNSTHTYQLTLSDNATPANSLTNRGTFTIADYRNILLPASIYFENFDSTEEGKLPNGWTETNYTVIENPAFDLSDLNSATYATWTVVNADRFKGSFITYSNPDNPQSWADDYHRVLSVNPLNVVNGQVVRNLAQGRFVFGDSGYRNGGAQVLHVFSPDFDLRGKSNVFVSYHSLWEQNQDSIGAVEFSIDQGLTWLPIVYMLDGPDVLKMTNALTGEVSIDAVATFTAQYNDVARYTDPVTGEDKGGTYGAFIGAALSQDLAPFISARVNDDPVESKRVEIFRLPRADNQAKVRFRFAHAGTDSWYFGVDDFGLYSIPPVAPPPLTIAAVRQGSNLILSWSGGKGPYQVQKTTTLINPIWQNVGAATSANSLAEAISGSAAYYRVVGQ